MIPPAMAPPVGEMCWNAAPPNPEPGFDVTAVHAFWTLVPGCSGNVVPGLPASANAGGRAHCMNTAAHKKAEMRRFMGLLLLTSQSGHRGYCAIAGVKQRPLDLPRGREGRKP